MFGRFPNDETLARDYIIVPAHRKLAVGYEEICATPLEARDRIENLVRLEHHHGSEENYAVYELVEFVTVCDNEDGGTEIIFSEDEALDCDWEEWHVEEDS